MRLGSLALVIYAAMMVEAARARKNERAQFARGGLEPRGDVYPLMRAVYPALFAAMIAEGFVRAAPPAAAVLAGAAVFGFGKALKWWAMAALGPSWTFRVVVVPGAALVAAGPYRFLRHPNYVGVVLELGGAALIAGALVAGPIALALFGALLLTRIRVEDRWLLAASKEHAGSHHRGT
ncbi:MAG TPA: isoprenylcysteine carboxylmethyltransferase family protein [Vicinamibacterales bacterium]|jgi:methyltransferase